eukprot:4692025-Pyramimonas_sp.AAC.1
MPLAVLSLCRRAVRDDVNPQARAGPNHWQSSLTHWPCHGLSRPLSARHRSAFTLAAHREL